VNGWFFQGLEKVSAIFSKAWKNRGKNSRGALRAIQGLEHERNRDRNRQGAGAR
jgi:hypothetical protein